MLRKNEVLSVARQTVMESHHLGPVECGNAVIAAVGALLEPGQTTPGTAGYSVGELHPTAGAFHNCAPLPVGMVVVGSAAGYEAYAQYENRLHRPRQPELALRVVGIDPGERPFEDEDGQFMHPVARASIAAEALAHAEPETA
jgi:hypothetical protein